MAKEYIEREALLKEIQEEIDFESAMYTEEQNKWLRAGLSIAARDVRNQPTADVVPRDEVEMHGASYYFKLEQAIESSQRFMAEHDAALAKKIFEEIEALILRYYNDEWYTVPDLGSDVAQLKEKYTKGGAEE